VSLHYASDVDARVGPKGKKRRCPPTEDLDASFFLVSWFLFELLRLNRLNLNKFELTRALTHTNLSWESVRASSRATSKEGTRSSRLLLPGVDCPSSMR